MKIWLQLLYSLIFFALVSCNSSQKDEQQKNLNDWETGTARIHADTNLRYLLDQIIPVYEHFHPKSKLIVDYSNEDALINDFKADKNKIILVSTAFDREELAYCEQVQKAKIIQYTFGYDAIAVISSRQNPDSVFYLNQLAEMLQNKKTPLVFDHVQSGIAKALMQQVKINPALFKNALVVNNLKDVVNYVVAKPESIGFIPFNLVSNDEDVSSRLLLEKIKLLPVRLNDTTFYLSQDDLANGQYPLYRPISIIIGNTDEVNALGFADFLMNQQVSKIMIHSGVIPTIMPERLYQYTEEFHPEGKKK